MMNSRQAYKVLELEPGAPYETIRRQYKMLALKYHPDKNKADDAADKYREIKEAHDVLCISKAGPTDDPTDPTGRGWFSKYGLDKTALGSSTYARTASDFFEMIYNDEQSQRRIFHPLLMRVVSSCEENALAMFRKMEKTKALKLYDILILYQDTLHLSADTLAKIHQIIEASTSEATLSEEPLDESLVKDIVVLNPNLDDLLDQSVYKLKQDNGQIVFVPLWHRELEYDGVFVDCVPTLPDNIWLDELNNIHVKCGFKVGDLWGKDLVDIQVGDRTYNLDVGLLRLVSRQTVRIDGLGIPVPNEADIFNVSRLSSVYAHVEIGM
jgi:curved DNA-binding protein CbpA